MPDKGEVGRKKNLGGVHSTKRRVSISLNKVKGNKSVNEEHKKANIGQKKVVKQRRRHSTQARANRGRGMGCKPTRWVQKNGTERTEKEYNRGETCVGRIKDSEKYR